jgi:DNA-binding NarL/FixJ family response regulator
MKLLIVDDSPEVRVLVREITREHAHEVVGEAENGKEAIDLFRKALPEMVLLDISMPIMGGFAAASELRRIAPEIPILFISQHSDADYLTEAFELGARGYLLKSAIYAELNQAIEAIKNNQLYRSSQFRHGKAQ